MQVLVIDSDSGFMQVLGKRMDGLNWQYRMTGGPLPVDALVSLRLDALIIDLSVVGPQAWTYLESVATRLPSLAILVVTGRASVSQRVRGLRLGADDWISKPCHPEEVVARVEAVARRLRAGDLEPGGPVAAGELEVRPDHFQAFVRGESVGLTRREFELLQLLAGAEGQVLQREDIYQRVWGYAMAHGDRSVDVFVRKLRSKLERASPGWRYIHTHFGVGYRFDALVTDAAGASAAPEVVISA
jgi:DNA-binding response OmpR family regulator